MSRSLLLGLALALWACDSDAESDTAADADIAADAGSADAGGGTADAGAPPDGELAYAPCSAETRMGGFVIELEDGFTNVQGQVADAVDPARVPTLTAEAGTCRLLQPPSHFCDPACEVADTCGPNGCVPRPVNVDVGTVTVDGLKAPVSMTARAPVWFYTFTGDLPHPGFDPGDPIVLQADGAEPFALRGAGIEPLEVVEDALPLERGQDATLTWAAPAAGAESGVYIELNIANHGGTPAWIACEAADTGSFAIPATLTDALLDLGFSGFPSVALVRRTVDSAELGDGCVELAVRDAVVLPVEIEGLVSCSTDEDCPENQTCQADLTCQ